MKKRILMVLILCCLALLLSTTALAVESGTCGGEGDGSNLTWTLDDTGTLTISGHGKMKDNYRRFDYLDGIIKEVIFTDGVTYIGEEVFWRHSSIEKIEIPDSVTYIGDMAFCRCTGIQEVLFPSNPNNPLTIGGSAFSECTGISKVSFPGNLIYIGRSAFFGCHGLSEIHFSDTSVFNITIEDEAFSFCKSLNNVSIPSGLQRINSRVFSGCEKLSKITIPNSVRYIESNSFYLCNELKTIDYRGTRAQWDKIKVWEENNELSSATVRYNVDGNMDDNSTYYYVEAGGNSGYYKQGEAVTITSWIRSDSHGYPVIDPENYPFLNWSAVNISTGEIIEEKDNIIIFTKGGWDTSSATFTMPNLDVSFYPNFGDNSVKYSVTVNNGTGSGSYSIKEEVTITADKPSNGMKFVKWTGVSGLDFLNKTDETYPVASFAMPARNVTLTATYEAIETTPTTYTVTVNNGSGSGTYAQGDTVSIRADSPPDGKQFKSWSGADGLTFTSGSASSANASFTMPARNVTLTATYETIETTPATYTVTVNNGNGSGTYAQGDTVSIRANSPPDGKQFKSWSGADGLTFTSGSASRERASFTMPAHNVTLTATYEAIETTPATYTVKVNNGRGSGTYEAGDTVSIRANNPADGKEFKSWSGADGLTFTSGSASSARASFTMPARNVTLTATYSNESFFDEPLYTAPNFSDFISAASALIQEYDYVRDSSPADNAYATGRLIVSAKSNLPDLEDFNPVQIVKDSDHNYLIQFVSAADAKKCSDYLNRLSNVVYTEPDGIMEAYAQSSVEISLYSQTAGFNSWGVTATKADAYAESLQKKGLSSSVTVAVVDSGVDSSHQFLSGRLVSGYDILQDDNTPQDGVGHGTHVAGTIVDCTPGLNIKVMPVRVLGNDGSGPFSSVGLGIQYAVNHGAKVINLSLGGPHSKYIDDAVEYALSKNVTVVVAAGNENANVNTSCPAHIKNCITVAAVDSSKNKADFSNYGEAVDIAAPGVGVKSCIPGGKYSIKGGTSMAAPHVAAAAAMLLYENGSLTPAQVEKKLRDAATDLGAAGWDQYYGAGFLNLGSFVGINIAFSDVPRDAYFYKAVMWAVEKGITNGTTSTTFSPHNMCTTAQILTFIWRASGEPEPSSTFGIESNLYYSKAIRWANEQGITGMYASSTADTGCTRASAMVYMWGLAGKPSVGINRFTDVPANSGYAQAVSWGVHRGVTNGTTDTTFSPGNYCSRAQIITFLYRYYVESV